MASLEDVRRYARQHGDQDRAHLARDIAKRYDMSREDADRLLADLDAEDGGTGDNTVLPAGGALAAGAVIAGGAAAGTGTAGYAGAGAAALGVVALEEQHEERDAAAGDDHRDGRPGPFEPLERDRRR